MTIIYGADTNQKITPIIVRDAIINCFAEAHCSDTGLETGSDDPRANRAYCTQIVKKAFDDTNGNYENPTVESLLNVLKYLADFSKTFRDPEVINKHYDEIMELVKLL